MKRTFADTLYFVALLNPDDQYHRLAKDVTARLTGRLLTTEFVLVEAGNFAADPRFRAKFAVFLDDLRANPAFETVSASSYLFESGLDLFRSRPDKEWSLTDCISFAVMEAEGIRDALTADHHFEQAGFNILLKLDEK
jgi:predicted nucleic acid-binding protein